MQTLDLSGESKKSDGRLKSLFWPSVENAWDVDYLGQQGFWLCLIIGIINFAVLALPAIETPLPAVRLVNLILAVMLLFVYWVGGMGVRQASWSAALFIFALYVIDQLAAARVPGILSFLIAGVLLSNVRATILASNWKPASEDEDRPTRFNETLRDQLVDQLPLRAWPILKYPFYFFATTLLLMLLATFANRMRHPEPRTAPDENAVPSSITVATPDSQ